MVIYKGEFSPKYDPNHPKKITGIKHKWRRFEWGGYYSSTHKCKNCGKPNWGWNLWKEDFLKDCSGNDKK